MRMRPVAAALLLLLVSLPSSAAIQYDFVQKNTTDDVVTPTTDLTGRATIDGLRSRIDFLGGTIYPPGTYVISTDGSQRLYFVDPTKQWYTEFNAASVTTALGASNIRIENLKSNFQKLDDRPDVAGIPSEHTTLRISYDITVVRKSIPIRSHVETEIESWTTDRFGSVVENWVSGVGRTGNAELDQLIAGETAKLTGFPLRQTVTTKTTFNLPSKSQLKVPPSRKVIRETWITAVREIPPDAALFTFPRTYRRADTPDLPQAATQTLTFEEPPTK